MVALACNPPTSDPRAKGMPTAMACSGRLISVHAQNVLQHMPEPSLRGSVGLLTKRGRQRLGMRFYCAPLAK